MMEILKFPDSRLFEICKPVTVFGPELKVLLDSMWETMTSARGIGLAANQVGLEYRLFTMLGPDDEKIYLVNPKIKRKSIFPVSLKEGCLSAPGEFVVLGDRAAWVQVEFQDEEGNTKIRVFKDVWSVCVQHEIGHLDGQSHLMNKTIPKKRRKELALKWGIA